MTYWQHGCCCPQFPIPADAAIRDSYEPYWYVVGFAFLKHDVQLLRKAQIRFIQKRQGEALPASSARAPDPVNVVEGGILAIWHVIVDDISTAWAVETARH